MTPLHLGNVSAIELNGIDLAPYVTDVSIETAGYVDQWRERLTVLPDFSFTGRFVVDPPAYLALIGRKHPRISRMRRAYRAKRRGW